MSFTIPKATLSLALLVQPEKALEFISMPQVHDQGTLGRFSLFDARLELRRRTSESTAFNESVRTDWACFVNRLIDMPPSEENRCIVKAATGARTAFDDYYNECLGLYDQNAMTNMESQMYLRSSEKAMAFSLLLNIASDPGRDTLSADVARRGIAIENWLLRSGLRFIGDIADHRKDAHLKKMEDLIVRKGSLNRSQLQHNHNYTAAQVNGLIEAVEGERVQGIQVVRETAINNVEQVTFVAV